MPTMGVSVCLGRCPTLAESRSQGRRGWGVRGLFKQGEVLWLGGMLLWPEALLGTEDGLWALI